jgi:uncharacterized protein YbaR (Trm112 family)
MTLIETWLLDIMQCPRCGGGLSEDESASALVCAGCGSTYPVVEGIPNMLVDDPS